MLSKFLVAFECCPLVFEFSVGIGGFVIGLGQIFFFFSSNAKKELVARNIYINLNRFTILILVIHELWHDTRRDNY